MGLMVDDGWWLMMVDDGWWWLMVDDGWWWLMMVDDGWWWLMMVDGWWWFDDGWPHWKKSRFITSWNDSYTHHKPSQPSYLQQLRNINQLYINHKSRTSPHFCWFNFLFVGKIYLWAPFRNWSRKQRWNLPGHDPAMELRRDAGGNPRTVPHRTMPHF